MTLPLLYPITDVGAGLPHLEQIKLFVAGGASLVQIRDKQALGRELYEIVLAAVAFARPRGVRIVVNDRVDIALAADADGAHVGQDDLPASAAREILGSGRIVGVSTHNETQLREAVTLPVDYVAIGPVFGTATKGNPDPIVGLDGVRTARSIVGDTPLVAIGGITLETVTQVTAAGATSVAVIGDLRSTGALDQRVAEYLNVLTV